MVEWFAQDHPANNWSCWNANPGSLARSLCAQPHDIVLVRTSWFHLLLSREGIHTNTKCILTPISLRWSSHRSFLPKQTQEAILQEGLAHQNLILRKTRNLVTKQTSFMFKKNTFLNLANRNGDWILNNSQRYWSMFEIAR